METIYGHRRQVAQDMTIAGDLTTVADGSTLITGDFASTANFGNFSLNEFGGVSSFVAKLDANGSFLWATKAGENQCCSSVNAYGLGVEASTDGSSIIATGHFQGECNFGDNTLTTSGSSSVFVAKLDSSGNYVWIVKAGGTSSDIGGHFTHRRKFSDYRTVPRHCTIR